MKFNINIKGVRVKANFWTRILLIRCLIAATQIETLNHCSDKKFMIA